MNYKRFLEITKSIWNDYFEFVSQMDANGRAHWQGREKLFPKILLITQTKHSYLAELLGASKEFKGLTIKTHKEPSINRYLNQFDTKGKTGFINFEPNVTMSGALLSTTSDLQKLQTRFPFLSFFKAGYISDWADCVFQLGDNVYPFILTNCLMVNTYLNAVSVKHILYLTAVHKDMRASVYERWLKEAHNSAVNSKVTIKAIHACNKGEEEDWIAAGQLVNTIFIDRLRETTIGKFLELHPEIIKRAVGTKKVIYEPYLPWLEKYPNHSDTAINPDLMIEREDGYFDIYDLKLALINTINITTGAHRARTFIHYVNKGLNQLSNYAEYFRFERNAEFAFEKYGIKVKAPNLSLVVGSFNNVNKMEIEEASRNILKNITIIDYESLLQLFLHSKDFGKPE